MSIERSDGTITFVCDECDDELETGCEVFEEALNALHDASWIATKVRGVWVHRCGNCA